mmetsp:Transcript_31989/g.38705  ORF Transcript_31989/g.38705 Transcript_31989/m.38705 type:complete len:232 (+) Transcript_31989:937-1632(+)
MERGLGPRLGRSRAYGVPLAMNMPGRRTDGEGSKVKTGSLKKDSPTAVPLRKKKARGAPHRGRWRTPASAIDYKVSSKLYNAGLRHVRRNRVESARRFLNHCVEKYPTHERAWVTLAQMEKRVGCRPTCEKILKGGLRHNPQSAAILQAWALHLLQEKDRRNEFMAYGLLIAAVQYEPSLASVLKWKGVREIGIRWKRARCRSCLRTMRVKVEKHENCSTCKPSSCSCLNE